MPPRRRVARKNRLRRVEQRPVDDRRMFAGIAHSPVVDLAQVHPVLEEVGERPLGEGDAAKDAARGQCASAGDDPSLAQLAPAAGLGIPPLLASARRRLGHGRAYPVGGKRGGAGARAAILIWISPGAAHESCRHCHFAMRRARAVYALRIFKPPRRPRATWSSPRRVASGVIWLT